VAVIRLTNRLEPLNRIRLEHIPNRLLRGLDCYEPSLAFVHLPHIPNITSCPKKRLSRNSTCQQQNTIGYRVSYLMFVLVFRICGIDRRILRRLEMPIELVHETVEVRFVKHRSYFFPEFFRFYSTNQARHYDRGLRSLYRRRRASVCRLLSF
jgi:hypothetical protein